MYVYVFFFKTFDFFANRTLNVVHVKLRTHVLFFFYLNLFLLLFIYADIILNIFKHFFFFRKKLFLCTHSTDAFKCMRTLK